MIAERVAGAPLAGAPATRDHHPVARTYLALVTLALASVACGAVHSTQASLSSEAAAASRAERDEVLAAPMADRDRQLRLAVLSSSDVHALFARGQARAPLALRMSYPCSYGLVSRRCAAGERASTDASARELSGRVGDAVGAEASWTCTGLVCRMPVDCRATICAIYPHRCAADSQHAPSGVSAGTLSVVVDDAQATQMISIEIDC